ncbi:MAG: serine--tRNA ligase, partial [Deltaproteobacteria bacterium]|nr:serine--tRNA ligase [Deltaproteobacteria bacterium]
MLDIKYLREHIEEAEQRLKTRGGALDLSPLKALDGKRRALIIEAEGLKARRNTVSQEIGRLKKEKQDASALMADMQEVSVRIKELDIETAECEKELEDFLLTVPNLPDPSVP